MKIFIILFLVGCAGGNTSSISTKSLAKSETNKNNFTPNEASYWIQLGINAREKKDFTPSFYAFNRGLGLGKSDQEKILAHQGLALLLLEFSNVEEAKIHFDKVVELSKKNKEVNVKSFTEEFDKITQSLTIKSQS